MTTAGPAKAWTTRSLLDWMGGAFQKSGLDSPRLCAELLLAHVLGCDRLRLYMEADRPATELELGTLRGLVSRALKHEPVQYLVGEAWFFSLPFHVDHRVLIPRPCTETIVEHILQHARASTGFVAGGHAQIGDVCTGSGCIAVALLKNLPHAHAAATDISADALSVARDNAQRHHVLDRLNLLQGNLLAPLEGHPAGQQLHYLVANPPYIPDHEWNDPAMMGANVKGQEPDIALRGGADGLDAVGPIVDHGHERLRQGGLLLVEIAASTADAVLARARANSALADTRIVNDLEGLPRVLIASRV